LQKVCTLLFSGLVATMAHSAPKGDIATY